MFIYLLTKLIRREVFVPETVAIRHRYLVPKIQALQNKTFKPLFPISKYKFTCSINDNIINNIEIIFSKKIGFKANRALNYN